MKKTFTRFNLLTITCGLIASSLVIVACSHWQGSEGQSYSRGRTRLFTDGSINNFMGSIRYKKADSGDHYRLGRHFQERGRHMWAVSEFSRVIDLDPRRADAHNAMGISYDKLLQFDLAEPCYRRALILKPDFAAALNNLGYSYLMQGRPEKAIAPLQKAVALQGSNIRFHNNLALAYGQTGQVQKAAAEFKLSGLNLQADSPDAGTHAPVSVGLAGNDRQSRNTDEEDSLQLFLTALEASETVRLSNQSRRDVSNSLPSEITESQGSRAMITTAPAKPLWVAPRIEISNGNGVSKMARNLGKFFRNNGFDVHRLSNADHFEYPRTRIFYSDGQRQVACDLSRMLFGPDIVCDLINNNRKYGRVKVLIGEDVAGLNDIFSGRLKIQVANGNGVKAIARRLSSYLRTKGFFVARPTNAVNFGYPFTQIVYPAGRLANAQFLARALPENCSGRLVKDDRDATTIQIVIGKDMVF
jgi:tetratricopeptide (TPR) repeat protein